MSRLPTPCGTNFARGPGARLGGGELSLFSAALAGTGVIVFAISLSLAAPAQSHARTIARDETAIARSLPASGIEAREQRQNVLTAAKMVARAKTLARAVRQLPAAPTLPTPAPTPVAARIPTAPVAVAGVATGPGTTVIASWYGPGFYGNLTACGQIYTPQILGVAHKTLPCGTLLRLEFRGIVVTAAVIDRGPYIAGRTLDLSNATRQQLACTDLCPVRMQILR